MDHLEFQTILKKYLEGRASPDEERIIDLWYDRMGKDQGPFLHGKGEVESGNRFWSRIQFYIRSRQRGHNGAILRWYAAGLAACALFIVISYLNMSFGTSSSVIDNSGKDLSQSSVEKIANPEGKSKVLTLPDGSVVTLEPKSVIKYARLFDGAERKVYLDGKAFFEVTHDADRPFKVYAGKVITKVLGTSFTVSAFKWEREVTVSVKTGRVSVYTKGGSREETRKSEIILTPNQQMVYHKEDNKVSKSIVEQPQAIIGAEEVKRMRFEESSPKVIFEAIEKAYGVDIVFDESKFSSCRITTNISDGNLFNRLHIMCELMNATYDLEEDHIVIRGEGCHSPI